MGMYYILTLKTTLVTSLKNGNTISTYKKDYLGNSINHLINYKLKQNEKHNFNPSIYAISF